MNKKMIVYILGKMMGVEGLLLLIPALVSLIYHEKSVISFLIVAAILLQFIWCLEGNFRLQSRFTEKKVLLLLGLHGFYGPHSEHFRL